MGSSTAGKPVWLEINSQRIDLVEQFYPSLFGWTRSTAHVDPWGVLTMFRNRKRPVGTAFLALAPFHATRWNGFLSGDPDLLARVVADHGGGLVARPEDSAGWGRTAELFDPHGHTFGVIALEDGDPADPPQPGECVLLELRAPEAIALADFYARLFGYGVDVLGDVAYLSSGGYPRVLLRNDPHAPMHHPWIPWFRSAAPAADTIRAERLGAVVQVAVEPVAGLGEAAILADPAGAYFGLLRPTA